MHALKPGHGVITWVARSAPAPASWRAVAMTMNVCTYPQSAGRSNAHLAEPLRRPLRQMVPRNVVPPVWGGCWGGWSPVDEPGAHLLCINGC